MVRRAWLKAIEEEPKAIWIVKPPASSCGRGIRVISRSGVGSVSKSKKCLVQVGGAFCSFFFVCLLEVDRGPLRKPC